MCVTGSSSPGIAPAVTSCYRLPMPYYLFRTVTVDGRRVDQLVATLSTLATATVERDRRRPELLSITTVDRFTAASETPLERIERDAWARAAATGRARPRKRARP